MRLMQVEKITGTTSDIFLEYIQRNLPEGVAMSVYQVSKQKLWRFLLALTQTILNRSKLILFLFC